MATKKYLSLDGLTIYDGLIKDEISESNSLVLADAKLYTDTEVAKKADAEHSHDDMYLKSEIDSKISAVNTSITNITSGSVVVKEAEHATSADSATTADTATNATNADVASKLGTTTLGSTTKPIYLNNGVATETSTYAGGTKVTLNGSNKGGSTASFYAPTGAGTKGNILTSNGTGAPTWADAETARVNLAVYSTAEVDSALAGKSDSTHNHDAAYDAKGAANSALTEAKGYTDTKVSGMATTTVVDNKISTHNTSSTAHSDIRGLITALTTKVNNFLDVDDTTTDQLSEILELIANNKGTLDSITSNKVNVSDIVDNLTTASKTKVLSANQGVALKALIDALQAEVDSKADETHGHAIADVSGLQSALDGKANSSHGTHVLFDSTNKPKMDGTAAFGTSTKVARADHIHPTDTSRAAKSDLDALTTTVAGKSDVGHKHAISDVTNLQSSLDAKQATITGGASSIASSNLTASRALVSDANGKVAVSAVTSTELGYLDGVTSAIQPQLDSKAATGHGHDAATTSTAGFMTAAMVTKLNGIATGATKVTVDTALSSSSTNPVQNKVVNSAISTLTSTISANTSSISANTSAISTLQTAIDEIEPITSEEISALFA